MQSVCVCVHVCVDSPVCSSVLLDSCGSLPELVRVALSKEVVRDELDEGSEKVSLKGSSEVVEVGVGRWVESEYGEDV